MSAVRSLRILIAPVALLVGLVLAPSAGAKTFRDGHGIHVLAVKRLDSRLLAVSVRSSALPGPANVRILLPSGYATHPHRRYPVLYLLHGTSGGASDWTTMGGAEQATAGLPLIVVMPDIALGDDGGGWCTNWPDRLYSWETFHIDQLIPWIDGDLRTVASRGGRAIAGLSQGGFCSMSYAARHPDLFSVALAYSGAPDIYYDLAPRAVALGIINATEVALDRVPADSMFGNPVTDGVNYAAHDPATLAENLRWTKLYLYWGNGLPGPFDQTVNPSATAIEGLIAPDNIAFQARLRALGIPAYFDPYGAGTHSWPYWARDLRWSIGKVMSDFAHPVPPAITYTSAEDEYSVYGWTVTTHRKAQEFSTLEHAGANGFALAGSGSATVLTQSSYKPGARYRVTLSGRHAAGAFVLRAGRGGRLRIEVPLGPPNPDQQYTLQAAVAGTAVYTTTVAIAPVTALRCPPASGRLSASRSGAGLCWR